MKAVITIETQDAESERRLKQWLADTHGNDTPVDIAIRDEVHSLMEFDSNAQLSVAVEVTEEKRSGKKR